MRIDDLAGGTPRAQIQRAPVDDFQALHPRGFNTATLVVDVNAKYVARRLDSGVYVVKQLSETRLAVRVLSVVRGRKTCPAGRKKPGDGSRRVGAVVLECLPQFRQMAARIGQPERHAK